MKVLLIEDHPMFRSGMRQVIAARWPSVEFHEAASMGAATAMIASQPLDLIILDLSLPDVTGSEAVGQALTRAKRTPVLVVSESAEGPWATRFLQMGVAGLLSKSRAGDMLLEAIDRVIAGGRYLSPDLASSIVERLSDDSSQKHDVLSKQEYRVMLLIAAGHQPSEIASIMHLSVKTVGTYRARTLMKCGWSNNTELTKYCLKHGLLTF